MPSVQEEDVVRFFGTSYAFSGSLDYSAMGAAMASLELHLDGTVAGLQKKLHQRVAMFDALRGTAAHAFSPIRMVPQASANAALETGERLINRGYFVSVVMFPVVPRVASKFRCLG